MSYLGRSSEFGVRSRYIYTAAGSETSISGADDNNNSLSFTDGAYVDVYLNGVLLVPAVDYNTSTANTIAGLSALSASDVVEVVVYDVFNVADTVPASTGGTFNGNITATAFYGDGSNLTGINTYDTATSSTGFFALPAGTTAQRPGTPVAGMIRHNTDLNVVETYNGTDWLNVGDQASSYVAEYLVVAGGGGGGGAGGANAGTGGGGAGGYIATSAFVTINDTITITVGAGGTGGAAVNAGKTSTSGEDSSFGSVATAIGGGSAPNSNDKYNGAERNGGSGAGGSGNTNSASGYPGSGTSGQGNDGGTSGYSSPNYPGGGGGGAGAAGGTGSSNTSAGNGGDGLTWLDGVTYAGGGGGGIYDSTSFSSGGSGGGGNGGGNSTTAGGNGTPNTGGGGGGTGGRVGGTTGQVGGNGGSGVVIVRYIGPQRGTGGTVSSSGGYTYHTFTSSGSYTA